KYSTANILARELPAGPQAAAGGFRWLNAGMGPSSVGPAAYSPDGKHLALGLPDPNPGRLIVCDAASGVVVRRFPGARDGFDRLAFSPNGRLLGTVGDRGPIHVWDTATGDEVCQFTGHRGMILVLAFSPDGRRLATGGWDTYALLWDVPVPPPAP